MSVIPNTIAYRQKRLRLWLSLWVVLSVSCQGTGNVNRNRLEIQSGTVTVAAWRNTVASSLLFDSLLQVGFGAILAEEADPGWDGSLRTLNSLSKGAILAPCAAGNTRRMNGAEPIWQSWIKFQGCTSQTSTLTGDLYIFARAASDGVSFAVTVTNLSLHNSSVEIVYNGSSTLDSLWLFADGQVAEPVWEWKLQVQYTDGAGIAVSNVRATGFYATPARLLTYLSGDWRQGSLSLALSSGPLELDFTRDQCTHLLEVDGHSTPLPWFPISLYAGSVTFVESPSGDKYVWQFRDCDLKIIRNGLEQGSYSPSDPEQRSFFTSSSGLLGTVPARVMLRLPMLNKTGLKLITRAWCDATSCNRFRYDATADPAGAFWLRTGRWDQTGSPTAVSEGVFEYSLSFLSQQATAPVESAVFSHALTMATDSRLFLRPLPLTESIHEELVWREMPVETTTVQATTPVHTAISAATGVGRLLSIESATTAQQQVQKLLCDDHWPDCLLP